MTNKLTILFYPVDGVGHLNACIGIGEVLRDRGHKVIFVIPCRWKGQLSSLGFLEEIYDVDHDTVSTERESKWGSILSNIHHAIALPSIEHDKHVHLTVFEEMFRQIKCTDQRFREIMDTVKPHVVVVDTCYQTPALIDQGVPWILSTSMNPLGISSENSPPAWSGYSANGNRADWKLLEETRSSVYRAFLKEYNTWMVEHGSKEQSFQYPYLQQFSPWANMYVFPKEMDYVDIRPNPPNWHQFDSFMKRPVDEKPFEVPANVKEGPGKLIYFSMGTIGSVLVPLMKRLIAILAHSPNRFIVSKGPHGDQIDLPDNMWGEYNLPQTKIIPLVDLVLTHGGNNTMTESFYYGKRMIILPLCFDQLDNGTRLLEAGLGLTFHPYKVNQQKLLDAIETLLGDDLLEKRMKSISTRIQGANSKEKAADLVESVACSNVSGRKNTETFLTNGL